MCRKINIEQLFNGVTLCKYDVSMIGRINSMSVSEDGLLLCTTSEDRALKIFDVINFGEHSK